MFVLVMGGDGVSGTIVPSVPKSPPHLPLLLFPLVLCPTFPPPPHTTHTTYTSSDLTAARPRADLRLRGASQAHPRAIRGDWVVRRAGSDNELSVCAALAVHHQGGGSTSPPLT